MRRCAKLVLKNEGLDSKFSTRLPVLSRGCEELGQNRLERKEF